MDLGIKTRAIYLPDIKCQENMPIFELKGNQFICITDKEWSYDLECIIYDDDWMIISIDTDEDVIANIRF